MRSPVVGKHSARGWILAQHGVGGNGLSQDVAHRKAVAGKLNCWAEYYLPVHEAVLVVGRHPAVQQAGHRDRHDPLHWNAIGQVTLPGGGEGGGSCGVDNPDLARLFPVDHDEAVAADAGHQRFDNVEGCADGNGCVHCITTGLEHADACLGSQGVPGAHHAVPPHDHGTVGAIFQAVG